MAFLCTSSFAQQYPDPGFPLFSTQTGSRYDSIDLANSNISLFLPLRSIPVGPVPLSFSLFGQSNAYTFTANTTVWQITTPSFSLTPTVAAHLTWSLNTPTTCNGVADNYYSAFNVVDAYGTPHPLSSLVWFDSGGCQPIPGGSFQTIDGSGYSVVFSGTNAYWTWLVADKSGNQFQSSYAYPVVSSTVATPDGVTASSLTTTVGSGTTVTDALTSTPVVSYAQPVQGQPLSYTYTDASGNTQTYKVSYSPYTAVTNFGCTNIGEYGPYNVQFYYPISIATPTGGIYTITYEPTPNYSSTKYPPPYTTGRIASITLPSGGSISYAYTGGNNGINCNTQVVPTLTRTITDNNGNVSKWTYVNSHTTQGGNWANYTVVVTDPATNQTVYNFLGQWQTQQSSYQGGCPTGILGCNGGGSLLSQKTTCYSGNFSPNCLAPSALPGYPVMQTDVYTSLNGGPSNLVETKLDKNGNVIEVKQYDFGASTPPTGNPVADTLTYYGQSWNGTSCTAYPSATPVLNTPCYSHTMNASGADVAKTQITYSNTGHPTTTKKWVSGSSWLTSTAAYNSNGTVASSVDVNGASYSYGYNGTGGCNGLLLTSTTYPLTSVGSSSQAWDCNGGVVTSTTDSNGQPTTYTYNDPLYRQIAVNNPDGGGTTTTYNTGSSLPWSTQTTTLVNGSTSVSTTSVMDGLARTVQQQTTDPQSSTGYHYVNTTYNNVGYVNSVTNPFFTTSDSTYGLTSYAYDGLGRVSKVTNPDTTSRTLSYYKRAAETVDESGITTISQTDGLGRTVSVCQVTSATQANGATPAACGQDIAGSGFLTSYAYDPLGNLTSVSQSGQSRTFTFDGLSRMTQKSNPESGQVNYTYDATGQQGDLYTRVAPKANQIQSATTTTSYSYDPMHRITAKSYSDGTPSASFAYDASTEMGATMTNPKGRLVYGASNGSQSARSYDAMGRIAGLWSCMPYNCGTSVYKLGYTYDYVGDPLTLVDSSSFTNRSAPVTFSYSFDADSRLTGMTSSYTGANYPATLYTVNSFNAFGDVTQATLGNGIVRNKADDTRGRAISLTDKKGTATRYSYSLGYFADNTVQTANDLLEGNWTYTYDAFNRLGTASETGQAFAYQYDQYGNRWGTNSNCSSSNITACQFTFSANNQITNGGFTYDAAGNVTYDGTYSYTYDAEGRVTNVKQGTTQVASYDYDALGQRTQTVVGSTTHQYIYDANGRPYEDVVGNAFKQTELYAGSTHVGVYIPTTTFFSHVNWLGTEVFHTGPGGSQVSSCTNYLPFGDGAVCTGTNQTVNQPQFTGQWQDLETDLDHMSNRYYSSVEGRWTTPDPAGAAAADPGNPQSWNQYVYVLNNPLSNVDPSGLEDCNNPGDCDWTPWDLTSGGMPVNPNALNGWDLPLLGSDPCGFWCRVRNFFDPPDPCGTNPNCVTVYATTDPVPTISSANDFQLISSHSPTLRPPSRQCTSTSCHVPNYVKPKSCDVDACTPQEKAEWCKNGKATTGAVSKATGGQLGLWSTALGLSPAGAYLKPVLIPLAIVKAENGYTSAYIDSYCSQ